MNELSSSPHNTVFPEQEWETRSPESQGIDSTWLARALAALEQGCGTDGIAESLLVRNGYVIHAGPASRKAHNIWSCTKSFVSTAVRLLVEDGLCSLDSLAADFEPLLREKYARVSLRHFVTMTSGFQAAGHNRWGEDSQDWSSQPYTPADPLFAPGTAFAYWDNAMNMFGRVLVQIGRCDLKSLLEERIMAPLQMGEWAWWHEDTLNGIPLYYASTGIEVNCHQLARFGWLFLNGGRWGDRRLFSPAWAQQATRPQVPVDLPVAPTDRAFIDGRGVYGFNWWTNGVKASGARDIPHAPEGLYYASGLHNNQCMVIPEWNMVFIRMGQDGPQHEGAYDVFFQTLGKAVV